MKDIPEKEQWAGNMNDHSGYDICDLYIHQKYASFKEEVSNYKYITMKQYQDLVVVKAQSYMSSKIRKQTKPFKARYNTKLHYDIDRENTVLGYNNLVCLILYTDWSKLSTDFSSSFRQKSVFEPISDTKRRNSEYWWWSKILRETVEVFGQCRYEKDSNPGLYGPFYTGMSVVMALPEFNLFLCSPTSTSIQIEVALKFGGADGMTLQFNNTSEGNNDLVRGFDCSWVSRYKEEDERYLYLYVVLNVS